MALFDTIFVHCQKSFLNLFLDPPVGLFLAEFFNNNPKRKPPPEKKTALGHSAMDPKKSRPGVSKWGGGLGIRLPLGRVDPPPLPSKLKAFPNILGSMRPGSLRFKGRRQITTGHVLYLATT